MNMPKTKDRMMLGIVAGGFSFIVQSLFDYASYRQNISKRNYWSTAAGVWVKSKRQAKKWNGQMLGAWMTFGLNALNGIFMVWTLTKVGINKWPIKGVMLGTFTGSIINALLSGFADNKVAPKDSNTSLSYALTNAITGLVAAWVIVNFGDQSLFNERRVIANTSAEDILPATSMNINESVVKESQTTYIH